MNLLPYQLFYRRFDSKRSLILYAKSEQAVLALLPKEVRPERIVPLHQGWDNIIRKVQKSLSTERFNQQKIITLLEMIKSI